MAGVEGRVTAVTGAGNGLGREYALVLARGGAKVVAEIAEAGGEAGANYDSVATEAGGAGVVASALAAYGRIDGVVSNAGILRDKAFHKMTAAEWEAVRQVHLDGGFYVIHAAWPHFREQKHGRVVVATSTSGVYGNFGQANYGAAKGGPIGLINTVAIEGAKCNVLANAIAPMAATRMTEDIAPAEVLANRLRGNRLTQELLAQGLDHARGRYQVHVVGAAGEVDVLPDQVWSDGIASRMSCSPCWACRRASSAARGPSRRVTASRIAAWSSHTHAGEPPCSSTSPITR